MATTTVDIKTFGYTSRKNKWMRVLLLFGLTGFITGTSLNDITVETHRYKRHAAAIGPPGKKLVLMLEISRATKMS